jgi:glucose-1-phosphate adenylyltransferase
MNEGNLVILAGGAASRMKMPASVVLGADLADQAEKKTKAMIGVGVEGRPLMDYLIENATEAGYADTVIVVSPDDRAVRAHYGARERDNPYRGMNISYAVQQVPVGRTKPAGTADALLQALRTRPDWAGQQFTVCNSDNLYSRAAFELLRTTHAECAMIDYDREGLQFSRERIGAFAVVMTNPDGTLRTIIEKPDAAHIAQARGPNGRIGVSMNIWRFVYDRILPFLEAVPFHPVRDEKEMPAAVMMMLAAGGAPVHTIPLREHVPDLTSRNDIAELQRYLKNITPGARQ